MPLDRVRAAAASTNGVARRPLLAAAFVPTGLVLLWLKPIVDETLSHDPGPVERLRALRHYGDQLVVTNEHHYRLAPEVFGRSGRDRRRRARPACRSPRSSPRRRWATFVLGGTLAVLALTLDAVAVRPLLRRRLALAVAAARRVRAVAVRASPAGWRCSRRSLLVLPARAAAGIVLQRLWPGDFGYGLRHGGPALATWIALVGGLAAARRRSVSGAASSASGTGWPRLAAALFVLPVVVHGAWHWSPRVHGRPGRALAAARRSGCATVVPDGRDRVRRRADELPHRRGRTGLRRRACRVAARREHEGRTDPYDRARLVRHWVADERSARSLGATARRGPIRARPPLSSAAVKVLLVTHVLPARGRRRRAAAAQVRDPPAGARDRDARARAGRSEVDPPRRRAAAADAGLGAPRALPRAEGPQARRGAARHAGPRARRRAGAARRPPAARPRRERELEPDRDPGRDPDRPTRGHRRRASPPRRRPRSTSSARR